MPDAVIVRDTVCDSEVDPDKEGLTVSVLETVELIEWDLVDVSDFVELALGLSVFVTVIDNEGLSEDVGEDVIEGDDVIVGLIVGVIEDVPDVDCDTEGVTDVDRDTEGVTDVDRDTEGVTELVEVTVGVIEGVIHVLHCK